MGFYFGLACASLLTLANALSIRQPSLWLKPTAEFDNCGFNLNATCDDQMKLFVDGNLLATSNNWRQTSVVHIPPHTEEIQICCTDGWILGGILAASDNGLITNDAWTCSSDNGTTWNSAHELGANGVTAEDISPDAMWIWTDRPTWTHTVKKRHTTAICKIKLPTSQCCPPFTNSTPTTTLISTLPPMITTTPSPSTPKPGFNLTATCDEEMKLFADGNLLATSSNWRDSSHVIVPANTEIIEIYCIDSGILGGILASSSNGLITDGAWNCSSDNGTAWSPAYEVGPNGNAVPDISSDAEWIWTGCIGDWTSKYTGQKNLNSVICKIDLNPVIDGGWSAWSAFSLCSSTCEDATKARTRTCSNPPPSNGGEPCHGSDEEFVSCGLSPCGGQSCPYTNKYSDCPKWKKHCQSGQWTACMNENCPKTCKCTTDWSPWSSWSTCSSTCGIAAKTRTRTCLELPCRPGITEETASCHLPSCGPYIQQKCFLEDSNITFLDLGHNHLNQDLKPVWKIADKGRRLTEELNTRPSIGLSNLGDVTEPVTFSGRVFSASEDDDVIGMVFGFWNEANFFVIASARQRPGPTNWYVARLHATCGSSCATTTTISDAIWDPQSHPDDITVLATGSTYWQHGNEYNFTVSFNPPKLLLSVNVTNENQVEPILETGIISAKTNDSEVDAVSRKGGFVGVYVDSQAHTTWDYLVCQDSHFIAPIPVKSGEWKLGMNINPCDGANFGYGGPWAPADNVGSANESLAMDFVDSSVWKTAASFVTIARHVDGQCTMSKTWELTDKTKSMYDYFSTYPGRIYATGDGSVNDNHISSDIPEAAEGLEGTWRDPIFGADGGLVFNWYYSNNGVRIAVPGGYKIPYTLPSVSDNDEDLHGLGNELSGDTFNGNGGGEWSDVAMIGPDCYGRSALTCKVVGTDRFDYSKNDGPCWGSYAIFVSQNAKDFSCQGRNLSQIMNAGISTITTTTTSITATTTTTTSTSTEGISTIITTTTTTTSIMAITATTSTGGFPANTTQSPICQTVDGDLCIFPFNYRGHQIDMCTNSRDDHLWCATKVTESGDYIGGSYGDCNRHCPIKETSNWIESDQAYYKFITESYPYGEAVDVCASEGGILAEPRTEHALKNLASLANEFFPLYTFALGLREKVQEGKFVWESDNSTMDLSSEVWNKGEPNNVGGENCVELEIEGKLNDYSCETVNMPVCEKPRDPFLIHTDSNFKYYKVPVPESSIMTSATVLDACTAHGMKPQCVNGKEGYHSNDNNCVRVEGCKKYSSGFCAFILSRILCSTNDPKNCTTTLNTFYYMKNWASGSACGVTTRRFCSRGKDYTSTSDMQYFAACIKANQGQQQRQQNFPGKRQQHFLKLSELEGSNLPGLPKQLEQESSNITSSQKISILNLPEKLEEEAPKIPSLPKEPNQGNPTEASLPLQPDQGDLGILSLPGQHSQEAPKLQSLTQQSGMKLEFQLKGKIGIEKVKISVDGSEEEFGLTTEWRLFSYPRPSTGSFSVEFLNDIGYTDVFIRGHESQVTDLLPNFPANKFLGCGTENEDEKCGYLREGTLMWNGKYTYTLKDGSDVPPK